MSATALIERPTLPPLALDNMVVPEQEAQVQIEFYHQVLIAEDPAATLAEVAARPGQLEMLITEAEASVALTATAHETGRQTKDERTNLIFAIEDYGRFMGLVADHKLQTLLDSGVSPERAKHEVVEQLVVSQHNALNKDIANRLESSKLERLKAAIARSTTACKIGGFAFAAATAGGYIYTWKNFGSQAAEDFLKVGGGAGAAIASMGLGARAIYKSSLSDAREHIEEDIGEYKRESEDSSELEVHTEFIEDAREKLYAVSGSNFIEQVGDTVALAHHLEDQLVGLLKGYYGLEDTDRSFRRALTGVLANATLDIVGIQRDVADEIGDAVVERAKSGAF